MKELRGGRYALVRQLGEGSQGETWEAIDRGESATPSLGEKWNRYVSEQGKKPTPRELSTKGERVVAIKAFRIGKAKAWKDVELAEREARVLSELRHPNLPRYVEHFEEEDTLYLVMEKIEGESLAAIRKAKRTLGPREIHRMLEDLASCFAYLHARAPAVIHRDIKPGNVIRRPDGSFALVDFGAVRDRLRPAGGSTIVGTFGFMAPEQFQGRASPKSDVYGAGATAIAMLTGCEPEELPHEGLGIDVRKAVPAGAPPALVRALEAMLEPDPDRRAASIEEALAEMHAPEPPEAWDGAREKKDNRKKRRREEREARRRRREEKREAQVARRDALAVARPRIQRLLGRLGLLVALAGVWLTVGFALPLVLILLSLVFGQRFRDAARGCVDAAKQAHSAIGRVSARLSGRAVEEEAPRLRVPADFDRVRSVTEPEAQDLAMRQAEARGEDADSWLEEKLESEHRRWEDEQRRRQQMKRHAQRKHWGR